MANRPDADVDAKLVRAALGGDRAAFGKLVGRYERILLSLCRQKLRNRQDAEDTAQETFLKAYRKLDSLQDPRRFGPWVYGIAFRAAIDKHRTRTRSGRLLSLENYREAGGEDPQATGPDAHAQAASHEERGIVLQALADMEPHYALVLTLRYQKHMSYKEIAEHLDEPAGTIANRLHRAVKKLREQLEPRLSEQPSAPSSGR
jgi:RNA polymerase sigma-70 factor (ECF subfamily)